MRSMACKGTVALLLCLTMLIFFTMVRSTYIPVVLVPSEPSENEKGTCPIDALKLGVCAKVLHLVNAKLGSPPTLPCCKLIAGLADLEAATCLCTALKANVLGINLDVPLSLSLILNNCGKKNNGAFQCPY